MDARHARYPFLGDAREAVEAADVDLAEVVVDGGPPVERGRERAKRALLGGTTAAAEPRAWSARAELLSYPIARVLVSLLDVPGAVEKYAAAEAATARARFVEDFEADLELRSAADRRLSLDVLLADFSLADRVEPVGDRRFDVAVTAYLELAASLREDDWRLVTRPLADGVVPVDRPELYTLLREAVRRRVAEGLPLSVPDVIADPLGDVLESIRLAIADIDPPTSFDVVAPEQFPPCQQALLTRIRSGEPLPYHSRFALVAFLVATGLDAEEVIECCEVSGSVADAIRAQVERLRDDGDGTVAAPPSCAAMVEYGDCVDRDELCETIPHPLVYYETALSRTDPDRVADWRDA